MRDRLEGRLASSSHSFFMFSLNLPHPKIRGVKRISQMPTACGAVAVHSLGRAVCCCSRVTRDRESTESTFDETPPRTCSAGLFPYLTKNVQECSDSLLSTHVVPQQHSLQIHGYVRNQAKRHSHLTPFLRAGPPPPSGPTCRGKWLYSRSSHQSRFSWVRILCNRHRHIVQACREKLHRAKVNVRIRGTLEPET